MLRIFSGHKVPVWAVAVIPQRHCVISALVDGTLKLWELNNNGKELHTLSVHTKLVSGVAVLPDNRCAVSTSVDGTLKLWNLESGQIIASFTADSSLDACAVAPDGLTFVAGEQSGRVHFLRCLQGV